MGKRKNIPRKVEKLLFQEAESKCVICGVEDVVMLTIHHIVPVSKNPDHNPKHMVVLCANCHSKADKGEITEKILYAAKSKVRGIPYDLMRKPSTEQPFVHGVANVIAGGNMKIQGGVHIKVDQRKASTRPTIYPGTVGEHKRMVGYLEYLVRQYNEFKKWECDKKGEIMKYPLIRVAYERKIKYKVKDTPVELFERSVAFLQMRIQKTTLGRIKKAQGHKLFSSFDEFDKSTGKNE